MMKLTHPKEPRTLTLHFDDRTKATWTPKDDITPIEAAMFAQALVIVSFSGIVRRSEWAALERHLTPLD